MSADKKHTVVAFGEVLWDLLPDQSIIGGAPFNFTYRINSLGDNGLMISSVGADQLGKLALQEIWNLCLSLDYIQTDRLHPTGTVEVFFDDRMNPDFTIIKDVAYDYIEFTNALSDLCKTADCFCYGTLAQRNEKSRDTLHKLFGVLDGAVCFYDINLRKECYSIQLIKDSLVPANIVKMNDSEAQELNKLLSIPGRGFPDTGKFITSEYNCELCLITFGEKGVLGVLQSGDICYVPGYRIDPVDPLGAGDAFSAGFIHTWLRQKDLYQACNFGNILGAIAATQKGATVPIQQASINEAVNAELPARNTDESLMKYIIK